MVYGAQIFRGFLVGAIALALCVSAFGKLTAVEERLKAATGFDYPLLPTTAPADDRADSDLLAALDFYRAARQPEEFSAFVSFLARHKQSPYSGALTLDLGLVRLRQGYYSQARSFFATAWSDLRTETNPSLHEYGDRALSEYALMLGKSGQIGALRLLLKSAKGRPVYGAATEELNVARGMILRVDGADAGLSVCAYDALSALATHCKVRFTISERLIGSSRTNLTELAQAAKNTGLNYVAAGREPGTPLPYPCIAHLKVGHYATVLGQKGGDVLLQDGAFGGLKSVSLAAFDDESTGYFLIPARKLGPGWRAIGEGEGRRIKGAGSISMHDASKSNDCAKSTGDCHGKKGGMAVYDVQLMLDSLHIYDTPVGYTPAVGPDVQCKVSYSQREAQDPPPTSTNFGPKWRASFIGYVKDNGFGGGAVVYTAGGGSETNPLGYPDESSGAVLTLTSTSPVIYQRTLPDGSAELYSVSDGGTPTRHVYLSAIIDPQGNRETLTYSKTLGIRLASITDSAGRVTTFGYTFASDFHKVTKITDPYGRSASFTYTATAPYHLASITDTIGITSSFAYTAGTDFIESMHTPYGTTTFTTSDTSNNPNDVSEWVEATNPLGQTERVEFEGNLSTTAYPDYEPFVPTIPGRSIVNSYLEFRNTFYWNHISYPAYGSGTTVNYQMAKDYHWCHLDGEGVAAGILESTKEPLENREYYLYSGQGENIYTNSGMVGFAPAFVGRALVPGQIVTESARNSVGSPTTTVDGAGRTINYSYAANGQDLLTMTAMGPGSSSTVLLRASNYVHHRPQTLVDRSGKTWTMTYNTAGQLLTLKDPLANISTWTYDTAGKLTQVKNPDGTIMAKFTYDTDDRVATATDQFGLVETYSYDLADRPTMVKYANGTTKKYTYSLLDLATYTDRQNRITNFQYNALRELILRTDPMGRATHYSWCICGHLGGIYDPNFHSTTWTHDIEGRVTMKTYDDGSYDYYGYESDSGRLSTRSDSLYQTKSFSYNEDGTIAFIQYYGNVPTPSVSYSYDPTFPRLSQMTDGTGTTSYQYIPYGSLGGGGIASIVGPNGTDPLSFTYDALGRRVTQKVGADTETVAYDSVDRITTDTNTLGAFNYKYLGDTLLPTSVTGGAVNTNYTYYTAPTDIRLKYLQNLNGGSNLATYGYVYNNEGTLNTWNNAYGQGSTPGNVTATYDLDDELSGWQAKSSASATLASESFIYDPAGNRSSMTAAGSTTAYQLNNLNQITEGTNATLGQTWSADYDTNGSITSMALVDSKHSTNNYAASLVWDADNRLISYTQGAHESQYAYNGSGQLSQIIERQGGAVVATRDFLWLGMRLIEEKNGGGTKRYFEQGVQETDGSNFYYARDQLGSVRQVVDSGHNVVANYQYDAFGNSQLIAGTYTSDIGYGGYLNHSYSGLLFSATRDYSSGLGRWISRDPIAEEGGDNLYAYVNGNPLTNTDPSGLVCESQAVLGALQLIGGAQTFIGLPEKALLGLTGVTAATLVTALFAPPAAVVVFGVGAIGLAGYGLYEIWDGSSNIVKGVYNLWKANGTDSTEQPPADIFKELGDDLPGKFVTHFVEDEFFKHFGIDIDKYLHDKLGTDCPAGAK
jgi:RHS repeat-associated protein